MLAKISDNVSEDMNFNEKTKNKLRKIFKNFFFQRHFF
jgi:hypothetical protein